MPMCVHIYQIKNLGTEMRFVSRESATLTAFQGFEDLQLQQTGAPGVLHSLNPCQEHNASFSW